MEYSSNLQEAIEQDRRALEASREGHVPLTPYQQRSLGVDENGTPVPPVQKSPRGSAAAQEARRLAGPKADKFIPTQGDRIKKTKNWHQEIVEWFLRNPTKNNNDCAAYFEKTPQWLSGIMNSDAFIEFRALRLQQHRTLVSEEIISKAQGLTKAGLDKLTRAVLSEDEMALGLVKDVTEMAGKMLGFGGHGTAGGVNGNAAPQVTLNFGGVTPNMLASARLKMSQVVAQNTVETEMGFVAREETVEIEDAELAMIDAQDEPDWVEETEAFRLHVEKELMEAMYDPDTNEVIGDEGASEAT